MVLMTMVKTLSMSMFKKIVTTLTTYEVGCEIIVFSCFTKDRD